MHFWQNIFMGDFKLLILWHVGFFAKYDSLIFIASLYSVTSILSFNTVTHIMPNMTDNIPLESTSQIEADLEEVHTCTVCSITVNSVLDLETHLENQHNLPPADMDCTTEEQAHHLPPQNL